MKAKYSSLFLGWLAACLLIGSGGILNAQEISITTQDEQAKALFINGRELFDNIRFDEAREVFDQALQKDSNFAMASVYRALTATTDGEFVQYLSKAVSLKSEVSDGERLMIESIKADADDQPTKAIGILKEAEMLYPRDKRVHHWLGLFYQGAGKNEEAIKHYQAAINIDPEYAPPFNNLGYLYRSTNEFAKSEEAFKKYVQLLPGEANPHDSIGDLYTKMGQYDQAIEHYQQALDLNPNFFFSQQKIGDNLVFKGLYEKGRQAYQKAIATAPTSTNKVFMHQGLANTYLFEGNYEKAMAENMTAISLSEKESLPENAATLYQIRAFINVEMGRLTEANADLLASEKIVNENVLTEHRKRSLELLSWRNRALESAQKGNFEKAIAKAEKIRQRAEKSNDPTEMETYNMVAGIIEFQQGNYTVAIEKLTQSSTESPYAQFYLAQSYQKAGMEEKARKLFTKVANWNENNVEYAMVRNKARSAAKSDMAVEE